MLKPAFQEACRAACEALARETADGGPAVIVGLPWVENGALYNAAALLSGGRIEAVRFKVDLPNYGVFDEKRVFRPGPAPGPLSFRNVRVGVPICEDIWGPDPVECIAETGGEILLVPNASPLRARQAKNPARGRARAREGERAAADLSQPGRRTGRTRLRGRLVRAQCRRRARRAACDLSQRSRAHRMGAGRGRLALHRRARASPSSRATRATMPPASMGLRDYVDNNRFPGVVLGLSGGIDSALCAAMAVDALGAARVHAVMLPYRYTSQESLRDAAPARRRSASATTSCRSASPSRRSSACSRRCLRAGSATSRKKTSRAARAA